MLHRNLVAFALLFVAMIYIAGSAASQDSPQQKKKGFGPSIPKAQITPHWFAEDTKFWYRNDLKGGAREFILVDADAGKRGPAFDHAKLAAGLAKAANIEVKADRLPFDSIAFADDMKAVRFDAAGKTWSCDLWTYECTTKSAGSKPGLFPADRPSSDMDSGEPEAEAGARATANQGMWSSPLLPLRAPTYLAPGEGDAFLDPDPAPEFTEQQTGTRQPKGGQGERPRDVPSLKR
jgi:hypothetical protein